MRSCHALLLTFLSALTVVGCATEAEGTEAEEGGERSEDAIQAGAAKRSGLVQGIYDGKDVSLEIIEGNGRQLATLYYDDGSSSGGSFIDVSILGKVTMGDSPDGRTKCDVTITTKSGVRVEGTCGGKSIASTEVVLRTSTALNGTFTCSEKKIQDVARMQISGSDDGGLNLRAEALKSTTLVTAASEGSIRARWSTKTLSFNAPEWTFHAPRPNRIVWHPQMKLVNGVPVFGDGTPYNALAGGVCTRAQ